MAERSRPAEARMRTALQRARRVQGTTHPNPSVGAVVYRGDRMLGAGATRPPGGAHAEVVALEAARRRHGERALRGASLAVTLEPCCFTGRTGPCTRAIIEAGIGRVYVGVRDPHARVRGRGIRALRKAGIEVEVGVLESECREHHRGFFSVCERGRPFVSVKLASTLDGRIATAAGESRWITGPKARAWVHAERLRVDAVMVGSGTALADDPGLTARRGERVLRRPGRVLVDGRLAVPAEFKIFDACDEAPCYVITRRAGRGARALRDRGVSLIEAPGRGRHVDLCAGLRALAGAGLTTLFVEGGGRLAAALLREGLVDELHWILAPTLLGADARPAMGPLEIARLSDALALHDLHTRRLGEDLHVRARLSAAS